MRLGFSIAAYLNSNVLLIDEVLAVGDIGFRAKCLLKCEDVLNNGNSIILVSHNMNDINRIASLAVLVEYGKAKNFESTSLAIATFQSLFLSKKERFSDDDFYLIEVFANCNPTQTYQTLKIFLRFNLSVFFTNIWLGFSITSINQTILFADTIIINQCEPGFHQFELVFDRLLLLQGSYSFGIFVWANNRTKHLFEDRNILELIIIDDKLDTRKTDGFVCLPYRYNHLLEEMQIC